MRGFIHVGAGVDGRGCCSVRFFLAWRSFILCLFFSNFCGLSIISFFFNRDKVVVLEDPLTGVEDASFGGEVVLSFRAARVERVSFALLAREGDAILFVGDLFLDFVPFFCFNRRVALAILAARAVLAATFDARVGEVGFLVGDDLLGLVGEDSIDLDEDSFPDSVDREDLSAILALRAADADCIS